MKPSIFTEDPMGSVFQKSENETIAQNIMLILKRTGDTFRELPWKEYKQERLKDNNFGIWEKSYFEEVVSYCANAERAMCFSPVWKEAYTKALKKNKYYLQSQLDKLTIYTGELNTERIKTYKQIAREYNIQEGTVRDIFCKGAEWAIEISNRK